MQAGSTTSDPRAKRAHGGRAARLVLATVLVVAGVPTARADVPDAVDALHRGDCEAAGAAINRGIERDDAQAYYLAGFLYDSTACVASEPARAARFYRQAADRGSAEAADSLGLLYGLGRGVERDYAEAYRWYGVAGKTKNTAVASDDAITQRLAGYAATIAHIAVRNATYPLRMKQNRIEATIDIRFVPATGALTAGPVSGGAEIGSNVSRIYVFVDAIQDAYRKAETEVPRPDGAPEAAVFVTPWHFVIPRDEFTGRRSSEGTMTIGPTVPAAR